MDAIDSTVPVLTSRRMVARIDILALINRPDMLFLIHLIASTSFVTHLQHLNLTLGHFCTNRYQNKKDNQFNFLLKSIYKTENCNYYRC